MARLLFLLVMCVSLPEDDMLRMEAFPVLLRRLAGASVANDVTEPSFEQRAWVRLARSRIAIAQSRRALLASQGSK